MDELSPKTYERMTSAKVDFSFRIYWTKMTRQWVASRRAEVRQVVRALTQSPDFEKNLIEKRYRLSLEDIPEQSHSGASLLALLDVLDALDQMEED